MIAATVMVLSGPVFLLAETIAAAAWSSPRYSYVEDYISDLGNPQCAPYDGRVICSPLHDVMNAGFAAQGLLLGLGAIGLAFALPGRARAVLVGVGVAVAVGSVLLALFHSSPAGEADGTLWLHYVGATLAIFGANLLGMLVGLRRARWGLPAAVGRVTVALGVVGLAAAVFWLVTFGRVPPGVPERIAVYAFVLWPVLIGVSLLFGLTRRTGPLSAP